jgi:predicted amidophosphoribosyltransferase
MGLYRRLTDWLTLPDVGFSHYECTECDVLLTSDRPACPECGGAVTIAEPELSAYYWE